MGCTSSKPQSAPPAAAAAKAGQSSSAASKPAAGSASASANNNHTKPAALEPDSSSKHDAKLPGAEEEEKEVKTLLLGSGESGKSTIIKQMKIIHQNGYTSAELYLFKSTIYKNVLDCGRALVEAIQRLDLEPSLASDLGAAGGVNGGIAAAPPQLSVDEFDFEEDSAVVDAAAAGNPAKPLDRFQIIVDTPNPTDNNQSLSPELVDALLTLWNTPTVQQTLMTTKRNQFYLMDSGPYFFHNLERFGRPDYVPTQDDILRARIKTTGIYETKFRLGSHLIHMYDVGGQRSERKKWIHCFENVTLIIFCVALSEYDQVLLEEKQQNRMNESLILFDSIINSRWFVRTSVVLFLNKIDVFTEKLPHSPLEDQFPDYKGGNDINKGAKYILWRFTQKNRAQLNIYPHLTQATDTSNIRLVFAAIKETILQNALQDAGILT